jgi:1-acyl-sn-glycerol-3-phosphate acyltransferase
VEAVGGGRAGAAPEWPYTWGRAFRWLALPITLLYRLFVTRTAVLGAEHLAGLPRRVILAGVHRSFADTPLVYYGLARSPARALGRRLIVATAATGIFRYRVYGRWAALAFGLYPLHQTSERDASLRGLERLAERGNALLIFPQGRHVTLAQEAADEPVARFRPGVAHLAAALGAVVVPFGLAGAERIVPPDIDEFTGPVILGIPLALQRGPLAIAFGPPLRPAPDEAPAAFTARLQAVCFGLARPAAAALASPRGTIAS